MARKGTELYLNSCLMIPQKGYELKAAEGDDSVLLGHYQGDHGGNK